MIASIVFHRLITDFKEKVLREDDFEGRRRACSYHDEAWCSSRGTLLEKKLSLEEKMFSCNGIWTYDLCNSQQKQRPATFSHSFFSQTSNLFFALLCCSNFLAKPLWNVIMDLCVPSSTKFLSILVVFGQNEIVNFLSKREFPKLVPSVVVLYSFFLAVTSPRFTQCSTL